MTLICLLLCLSIYLHGKTCIIHTLKLSWQHQRSPENIPPRSQRNIGLVFPICATWRRLWEVVLFPDELLLPPPVSQQMPTGCSERIIPTICKLIGKIKENPERNKFPFALSAPITVITLSQSQAPGALSKMRNSADLLRQSRERRRAFDRS